MSNDDLQSKASDFMKKALALGVGAVFLTEENLRTMVKDFKLPKEMLINLMETAKGTRQEFLTRFTDELVDAIQSRINPDELVRGFLRDHEIEFTIRTKFIPRQPGDRAGSPDASAIE